MERLHKKCLIASVGMHSLLVIILFIGPAFLSSPNKPIDAEILDFIPDRLIDGDAKGGGNPNARPLPPQPIVTPPAPPVVQPAAAPPPAPKPQPDVKPVAPDPPAVVKNKEPDPDSLEAATDKPKRPKISLTKVVRKDASKTTSKKTSDSEAADQRREYAENQKRIAGLFNKAAGNILAGAASATTVEGIYGPGGGGPTYASYAAWVKTVYDQAWLAPEDSSKDDADVVARVTIAQDGTIVTWRIVTPSGDPQVDGSVRRALESVKTIGKPFPEGAKEKERSYKLRFNLKAKRGLA